MKPKPDPRYREILRRLRKLEKDLRTLRDSYLLHQDSRFAHEELFKARK